MHVHVYKMYLMTDCLLSLTFRYLLSPLYRAPGFAMTFMPTVLALFYSVYMTYLNHMAIIAFPAIGFLTYFVVINATL